MSLWTKSYDVTIQMKATEQYFTVVLFIMLYKMVLTFESMDEILWCDHSNESYWAVLSCATDYYAVQGDSNFWVYGRNPMMWPFKWKLVSSALLWYCLLCCTGCSNFWARRWNLLVWHSKVCKIFWSKCGHKLLVIWEFLKITKDSALSEIQKH